jgi:DNA-binding response OmpR family regulator
MKLLIIEDEPKTAAYLKKGLSEQGFVVDTSENGELGLELTQRAAADEIGHVHGTLWLLIRQVVMVRTDGVIVRDEMPGAQEKL